MKLYIVYLGGKLAEGRMGEDHEVIAVIAEDDVAARKRAKAKWKGVGDPHVDAVHCLDVVDGRAITVADTDDALPSSPIVDDWVKLNPPEKCGKPVGLVRRCARAPGHADRCDDVPRPGDAAFAPPTQP